MQVTLPEIAAAAVTAVTLHMSEIKDKRIERWIAEGMEINAANTSCPRSVPPKLCTETRLCAPLA
jgi:wobble nucleotide-excising tRNase